jgi:F-type H+-transporting ATPase subunit a
MSHFWEAHVAGQVIHLNTLIMAWAAMALIVLASAMATQKLTLKPTAGQMLTEGVYNFCRSITLSTAGKRGDTFLFYIGSVFLFVLVANLMGQLPLKLIHLPQGELLAATGDFNVPAALAVLTVVVYFTLGIKQKGLSYFKHYLSPLPMLVKGQPLVAQILYVSCFWPFILLNILEDVTRPGSLMIRLFFNILIGEILAGIAMSVTPYVLPSAVIFLELFVAFVQAYIFAVLSSVYIAFVTENHDEHDDHAHSDTAAHPA